MKYRNTSVSHSRGGGGGHLALRISRKNGSFLRPPHVRDFVNEGYFLYQIRGMGDENLLKIHEIYAALTPSDSRSDFAAAKHAEDY